MPRIPRFEIHARHARRLAAVIAVVSSVLAPPGSALAADDPNGSGALSASSFQLRGFGNVDYRIESSKGPGGESTEDGFLIGQFDLFMTSRLRSGLSFLAETVFETGEGGETIVDIERFFIRYAWSDALKLAAGRTHTPLGYWNEAYHHGALLQPTVDRPLTLGFEDDHGILPVHSVGLELTGAIPVSSWEFAYATTLANGRGFIPDQVQMSEDLDGFRATALKLTMVHSMDPEIQIGPTLYRDRIPANPDTSAGQPGDIDELITGAHAFVRVGGVEVLGEYFHIGHDERGSSREWFHDSGYAIASVHVGRWAPYLGLERRSMDDTDPFYAGTATATRSLLGIRMELGAVNVIKLEVRRTDESGVRHDGLVLQTAFTF